MVPDKRRAMAGPAYHAVASDQHVIFEIIGQEWVDSLPHSTLVSLLLTCKMLNDMFKE
jgi:hypothetical protein